LRFLIPDGDRVQPRRRIAARPGVLIVPLFLIVALAAGSAGAQMRAVPLNGESIVYEMEKYSVRSPQGRGWFELKRDKRDVFFGKKLASPTHSFIAISVSEPISEKITSPEAYRDFYSRLLPTRNDKRNAVIENQIELDAVLGRYCLRYYTKAADREAVHAKGKTLFSETFGVACLHPEYPTLLVDVSYTERGHPSEFNTVLRAEGEGFLRSLKFHTR
jgi:hypothetical protein